jgi:translation initiation factor 2 beta subunit (eIF-2beta)/eIF-5
MANLMQLSRECDQIAAEFYNSDANTKKMVYENWLKKVKLTANYIDNLKKKYSRLFLLKRKKSGSESSF